MSRLLAMEPERLRAITCRLCRRKLELREQPEGICDACLHAHSTRPGVRVPSDDTYALDGYDDAYEDEAIDGV